MEPPSGNDFEKSFLKSNKTYVHPSSIIGKNVILNDGVKIGPFCTIIGNVVIQKNTKIYNNVSIGFPAQNIGTHQSLGQIQIGKNCNIREYVTIGACKQSDGTTIIGDNCYIMCYTHIAHDVIIEDNVTLINNVNLGGHTHVEKNAMLMANCATHQFCRIGQYCALSPYSAIRQDLPPFCMFAGLPAKFCGLNTIALKRAGFSISNINSIKHIAKLFYQDRLLLNDIENLIQKESQLQWTQDENVSIFLNFLKKSKRGVSKKI
ncbi:acyl-ACP--UDP-N-acetylglucosamine O-acyltransferase [Candidatus Dependentiae bacterium]|nr:acyl-ACP--UDP-N-acetylglucosamine O-acyltransferase [Candidatus Dependentiae bacterium]